MAGAETKLAERPPEVRASEETDLRVEVAPDPEVLQLEAVAVAVVFDPGAVACRVVRSAARIRPRVIRIDEQRGHEREPRVDAIRGVRAGTRGGLGPVCREEADRAAAEDVALQTDDGEVRRLGAHPLVVTGLDVQQAD